ncbi:histidinol phosphatase [Mucilaginibacter limnophilus]|uniref:protein-tyrosine-phosphatase n=1 Tax=Mucilaginibacter limnophilus TaxID=1932778 RepID=A0A3S2UZG1_9SPHI|nr:CpsB/CapC family capsule biosynthesis tyrosine phosphatase [Mucilaginibacter limnophilus]RVT96518.1 histidinol phosphatase [Mucilaginibacter limnophilus]
MFNFFKKSKLSEVRFDWLGTDIHSHLLPGLDDGSPDLEASIQYFTALKGLGFNKFICTPHVFTELYPNNRETITNALNKVKAAPELKDFNISAAAEYMVDADFNGVLEQGPLMNMPGNYVLIEMSYLAETPDIEQHVFNLKVMGYELILAHPERYNFYHGKLSKIERLKDMGCLLQLNLLSTTGYYGKEVKNTALKILGNKWYSLAATDFHHAKHLQALQDARLWQEVYQQVSNYDFRNTELFGS